MKNVTAYVVMLLIALGFTACGSGTETPAAALSPTQEAQVVSVLSSIADIGVFPSGSSSSTGSTQPTTPEQSAGEKGTETGPTGSGGEFAEGESRQSEYSCVSGSVSSSGSGSTGSNTESTSEGATREFVITFDSCSLAQGDGTTLTLNGVVTKTETGERETPERVETLTFNDLSIADAAGSFTVSGSVAVTSQGVTFTNFQSAFSDATYILNGSLTMNDDATFSGSLAISGSASVTCSFANFNPGTATDDDYAAACGA